MAKGARASSIKTNNAALKKKVFGPVETSRTERLSAKLLELASQPKPEQAKGDVAMDVQETTSEAQSIPVAESRQADGMDVDQDPSKVNKGSKSGKGRIEKRRSSRKASIVFPKYKKGNRVGKSKGKK